MILLLAAAALIAAPATAPKPVKVLRALSEAQTVPTQLVAAPPPRGSAAEAAELDEVRRIVAAATPERLAQAHFDDEHEDPSIFDAAVGGGFAVKQLPATWALLQLVKNDGDVAANRAKKYFARVRPWGIDATLPNCDAGKGKSPLGSYPSGHATLGYSVGMMLANLLPEKAAAILARARDYAYSREVCGVHFPSDTEASHVIGTVVAQRILADPAQAAMIDAARRELRTAGFTKG